MIKMIDRISLKHIREVVVLFFLLILMSACGNDQDIDFTPALINPSPPPKAEGWWQPVPGFTWQWQLDSTEPDLSPEVTVFDLDYETDPALIAQLKQKGIYTICYISVGSWEDWRPDADQFPRELLGKRYQGWQGERWLDIRRLDLLAPLLQARMDQCQQSGFDALEPDNMELTGNPTGFPITNADQLVFAQWLAKEAHARGLAIGQKNTPEMTADLVDLFDFAISEDCFAEGWCSDLLPYTQVGKAVFSAEYTDTDVDFEAACLWGEVTNFSFILKNRDLGDWLQSCPDIQE
jgi:hypothetical protein